jgi:hypothetical protein
MKAAHPDVELWHGDVTDDDFVAALAGRMTVGDAQAIRHWRVDREFTWRMIAEDCHSHYLETWRIGWTDPSNQWLGELICRAAARRLGDNSEDDWFG